MLHTGNIEPTIDELLHDSIAELLRQRDQLPLETVQACIEEARRRLRWRSAECSSPIAH